MPAAMRAYVEAYGCTLNFGESREIETLLAGRGWEIVEAPERADVSVLVTCVVIDKTERKMLRRVKALGSSPRLVVTGCMATTCFEKARAIAPHAEFVPPGDMESFVGTLGDSRCPNARAPRRPPEHPISIVPIATGCVGDCAYCITRIARGELKSRSMQRVVDDVRRAVSEGPREVQLTAQDTAAYGVDIGLTLPGLVREVCAIPWDFRVRIGMMNPRSALVHLDELAEIYQEPKVFKFLHIPVQSGSDSVLVKMSRGYSVRDFERIVSRMRSVVPEVTLSTDLIVGYPGETAEDHRANLDLVSRVAPDIVNVTRFSERPGTRAVLQTGKVAGWEAKDRSRELTKLRFSVALGKNRRWVGRTVRALSTEPGKSGTTIFRTGEYKQVVVPGENVPGEWHLVRVTGATATYLRGMSEGRC